jgi:hypothetical protein
VSSPIASPKASPKASSPKGTKNAQNTQKASGNKPVKRDTGSGKSGTSSRDMGSGKYGTSSKHGGEKKDTQKKGGVSSVTPQAPRRKKKKRGVLQSILDYFLYGGSQIELPEGPARTACDMLNCKYNRELHFIHSLVLKSLFHIRLYVLEYHKAICKH